MALTVYKRTTVSPTFHVRVPPLPGRRLWIGNLYAHFDTLRCLDGPVGAGFTRAYVQYNIENDLKTGYDLNKELN